MRNGLNSCAQGIRKCGAGRKSQSCSTTNDVTREVTMLAGLKNKSSLADAWATRGRKFAACCAMFGLVLAAGVVQAQETVCARVKIEIKQELTLERQAFDATMKINNSTDTGVIENVSVVVKVTEENGAPVAITDDPNNVGAKFYVRVSQKQNISNVDGSGTVNPASTAIIDWLIIPAPGSAGSSPLGKKYLVGATLKYRFAGEDQTLDVSPGVITVKPLPLLTLDYFLTQDVVADDPMTPAVEAVEPFTLGVRVRNNGFAAAKNLKIDSAQPKIVENEQGLLINFKITGSYVNDAPVQNSLLLNFGDIAPSTSKMGRWLMETTLAGKFVEFTAKFTHADELGGALTSILQATNAHFLVRDVRVDLPGRDIVRDFLAKDGDVIRVYESEGTDTVVSDLSGVAQLTAGTNANYGLVIPATQGFVYVKLPDPYAGQKALGQITRSDAKVMLPENVWLSKTKNDQTKQWEYWINFFDVNTTGVYNAQFQAPAAVALPPQIQFIPDRSVKETKQLSFLVEASSPNGKPVTVTASPLPSGAVFTAQGVNGQTGLNTSAFDWTPAKGQAGVYSISYTATDGVLSTTATAKITVQSDQPALLPVQPAIDSPLPGSAVTKLKPNLVVRHDPTLADSSTRVVFQLFSDENLSQPVESGNVNKGTTVGGINTSSYTVQANLNDNTWYWWRARSEDATLTSSWAYGKFFVNLFNDPPEMFNLVSPGPGVDVTSTQPTLVWNNATDKDGDSVTHSVYVYKDAALNTIFASATGLLPGDNGMGRWKVTPALTNNTTYYWRVIAQDANGADTSTPARPFRVNDGANFAPTLPAIIAPLIGSEVQSSTVALTVGNAIDSNGDVLTYTFELDTEIGFGSANKRVSGPLASGSGQTVWTVSNLLENTRYYWRVNATDGHAESGWAVGQFLVNAVNDPPPLPTAKNPDINAWVASLQPTFEVSKVQDPEGTAVRYYFELYRYADLSAQMASGSSDNGMWTSPVALADKSGYWWRYRAEDQQGVTSAWSALLPFQTNTGGNQLPTIQVFDPSVPTLPDTNEGRRTVTLHWSGTDMENRATVALYYAPNQSSFTGSLIVDGLSQDPGTQAASYVWDVTGLAPGAYYVYGIIYDSNGMGRSWAPGAVVIPALTQTGRVLVQSGTGGTDELGKTWPMNIKLNIAPTSDVKVPMASSNKKEGVVQPAELIFTPQNWSVYQRVTVTGVKDCVRDGNQKYQVTAGKAVTLDPNFIGVSGSTMMMINMDNGPLDNSCAP